MDDAEIDLEEFKQLRAEIITRISVGNQITSYAITALAGGVAISEKLPEALLGAAVIATFFWLIWLDHTGQVLKLAGYIGTKLVPRLQHLGKEVLGWERFMRHLDAGGKDAALALYGPESNVTPKVVSARATRVYVGIIFGSSAPVLVIMYLFSAPTSGPLSGPSYWSAPRVTLIICVISLWLFALRRAWLLRVMANFIDRAILLARGDAFRVESSDQKKE
jgi:hypothetical protein